MYYVPTMQHLSMTVDTTAKANERHSILLTSYVNFASKKACNPFKVCSEQMSNSLIFENYFSGDIYGISYTFINQIPISLLRVMVRTEKWNF